MDSYDRPLDVARRPWQRRIEVFSPKLRRRVTFLSRRAYQAWLLLEGDSGVRRFCERPALLEEGAARVIDFWVDRGRRAEFWLLVREDEDGSPPPQRMVQGLPMKVIRSEELLVKATFIRNWSQIVPYLVSAARFADPGLQRDLLGRLAKPHRLQSIEAAFSPIDGTTVRAALYALLASGKVVSPELEVTPLCGRTVFRRWVS
jgi:hypothetical protein